MKKKDDNNKKDPVLLLWWCVMIIIIVYRIVCKYVSLSARLSTYTAPWIEIGANRFTARFFLRFWACFFA